MKLSTVKKSILTAVCIALCVVLPQAFHAIPNAGAVYLPMHIPVLLCGLICGWQYGLLCGLAGPLLSSLLTQMPPMAILPAMMLEVAIYGAVCGIMMRRGSHQACLRRSVSQPDLRHAHWPDSRRRSESPDFCPWLYDHGRLGNQLFRHLSARHCHPACFDSQHCLCPGKSPSDSSALSQII